MKVIAEFQTNIRKVTFDLGNGWALNEQKRVLFQRNAVGNSTHSGLFGKCAKSIRLTCECQCRIRARVACQAFGIYRSIGCFLCG